MSTLLEVEDIQCGYGAEPVVDGLRMRVPEASVVCLLGPSGCGKTTVLRAIAGFNPVSRGHIRLRGVTVSAPGRTVPPERRGMGMVFQDNALFPHLTVRANVAFGLRGRGRREADATVRQLLELMGLEGHGSRYPHELSGGEQQRVALARALAPGPDLILLDEPFSNLDVDLRERLGTDVSEILGRRGIAAVLVTHDQSEAFALAGEVGVMREGGIVQWDTPYNLYHRPHDRFVADFIGQGAFVPGHVVDGDAVETEVGVLRGRGPLRTSGAAVDVLLRPDDLVLDAEGPVSGVVVQKAFRGAESLYTLVLPTGRTILSLIPGHHDFSVGEHVRLRVAAEHLVVFPTAAPAPT